MVTNLPGSIVGALSAAIMALLAVPASAASVSIDPSPISWYRTYTSWGDGDVIFKTAYLPATCSGGFFIPGTDAGYRSTVAALIAAYHAGKPIQVWAFDHVLWNGSATPTCKVDALGHAP